MARNNGMTLIMNELSSLLRQELTSTLREALNGGMADTARSAATKQRTEPPAIQVIVNNHAAANVTAQEKTDSMDQKTLEITIDQMVASSLVRGQQTTGVMRGIFGLMPSLINR